MVDPYMYKYLKYKEKYLNAYQQEGSAITKPKYKNNLYLIQGRDANTWENPFPQDEEAINTVSGIINQALNEFGGEARFINLEDLGFKNIKEEESGNIHNDKKFTGEFHYNEGNSILIVEKVRDELKLVGKVWKKTPTSYVFYQILEFKLPEHDGTIVRFI